MIRTIGIYFVTSTPDHRPMRDMPDGERPREKLLQHGTEALTNAELVALILGSGTRHENVVELAARLLAHGGGLHGLARLSALEIQRIKGLGDARSAQILAALELGRRLYNTLPDERLIIESAADAARLVQEMAYLQQEQIRVILLDTHRRVIAIPTVYIGTVNMSIVRVAEIYREAILRNSPAIILVHNHPSGDIQPSPEDLDLTRTLATAGKLLDIQLVDHLIIGERGWKSLREMGLGFNS
jgi:DNA repair protein RadC